MQGKLLRRGKLWWRIDSRKVTVFDKFQATVYHIYGAPNEQCLSKMKTKLLGSRLDEYGDWVEAICLARECQLIGYGTSVPKIKID